MTTLEGLYRRVFGWKRCRRCGKPLHTRRARLKGIGGGCALKEHEESIEAARQMALFGSTKEMVANERVRAGDAVVVVNGQKIEPVDAADFAVGPTDETESKAAFQAKLDRLKGQAPFRSSESVQ